MLLQVVLALLGLSGIYTGAQEIELARKQTRFTPTDPPVTPLTVVAGQGSCPGGCWVPVLSDNPRTCGCVVPNCTDVNRNQDCNICQRGWGVYPTKEDCDASGPPPVKPGLQRRSYPTPLQEAALRSSRTGPIRVASTTCPSTSMPAGETRTDCPFYGSDLVWWQDSSIWSGGPVPTSGVVILPPNINILIAACSFSTTPSFDTIYIPSTTKLIFADQALVFRVGSIIVDGQLLLGGPSCRLTSRVRFHFRRFTGLNLFDYGIQVNASGRIDMHGADYSPTWSFLAATATAGTTTITLQDAVPWEVDQQIVVVTTYFKDLVQNQNEVKTILAVSPDRMTLTLDSPLTFMHYGNPAEYQAEVGLLSRNIVLHDDAATPENNLMGPTMRFQGSIARFSGVQTHRMGQFNTLGKYPFHWHLVGNTTEALNFIRDSACYNSRFRCVTLHGISGARVEGNVAFSIQGSAFYLEAGVEENNVLHRNLAALVMPLRPYVTGSGQGGGSVTEGLLVDPADAAAAGIYATNLYNTFTNNAVSGGFFAYSFPVVERPLGIVYRDWTWWNPSLRPFKLFANNVGHSSGYLWDNGGCLYTGGFARYNAQGKIVYSTARTSRNTKAYPGATPSSPSRNADDFIRISNFRAYLCHQGVVHWGNRIEVTNLRTWDVTRAATYLGTSFMKGADINAQSGNPTASSGYPIPNYWDMPPLTGFQWYDTWTITLLSDVTFRNFRTDFSKGWFSPCVFWTITWSNFYVPSEMSFTKNIQLVNVENRALLRLDWADSGSWKFFNWVDTDGTASGRGNATVIGSPESWWKAGNNTCEQKSYVGLNRQRAMAEQLHWMCDDLPGQNVARIEIEVPGVTNRIDGTPDVCCNNANSLRDLLGWVSQIGYNSAADWRGVVITKNTGTIGWQGLTTPNTTTPTSGWFIQFANSGQANTRAAARELQLYLTQLAPDNPLFVVLRYPLGTTFRVTKNYRWNSCLNRNVQPSGSDALFLRDAQGLFYHTITTGNNIYLYLKLVDSGNPWGTMNSYTRDGMTYNGVRWRDLWYSVVANIPNCSGRFCSMPVLNPGDPNLPAALPAPSTGTCQLDTMVTGVWMQNCLQVGCGNCNNPTVMAQNGCRSICQRC